MKKSISVLTLALAAVSTAVTLVHTQTPSPNPPPWAYGFAVPMPPGPPPPPAATTPAPPRAPTPEELIPRKLPGSDAAFTLVQIRDAYNIADWYPGDHPPLVSPMGKGRAPDLRACGLCHYPNGKGRPENAGVSGLPAAYIRQQLMEFRADKRKSADYRKANTSIMITIAKSLTDEEIKTASEYFSSIKWTQPWITVKETDMVPKTRIAGGMFLVAEGKDAGTEPIGTRIIEVPVNTEHTETLRDPRSGFIAYVPVGSVARGKSYATMGGDGKTTQCIICHGKDLKGIGPVPSLAGRSPSYLVRQMYDMQQGTRDGLWTPLMKQVLANLTEQDMLEIAAYAASIAP